MNLDELHTPHPLRDADFAAIRARVKAEIAQREERGWLALLLRFAFAAALIVAFVPLTRERAPEVPVQARKPPQVTTHNPEPEARQAVILSRGDGEGPSVAPQGRSFAVARPRRSFAVDAAQDDTPAVTRIEIQTADPTIRIIWLTQPKENNS